MPTYRVIWEFNSNTGNTFEEVYYREATDANEASRLIPSLQAARLELLHPLNTFIRVRSSNVAQSRDTGLNTLNLAGTYTQTEGPAVAGATIVFNLGAQGSGSRKLWLRGFAGSAYRRSDTTGRDILLPYVDNASKEFFAALKRNGYGIRKLTPIASNPTSVYAKNPIEKVDGTKADGTAIVTYKNALVYAAGQRIVIGGTNKKDVPSLNGHFSVIDQTGKTVTIPYRTPNDAIVLTGGGYLRLETYGATAVFDPALCGFSNLGTRDTKSPLSHSRGARRAARIRLSR